MANRRTARVAQAVRQVVSTAILFELRDPRVKNITVLHVEVPPDLRTAKVYVSILGDEKTEVLSLKGLEAARGWIQSRIAEELDMRLTPVLTFIADQGVKKSIEIAKLLREINLPEETSEPDENQISDDESEEEEDNENSGDGDSAEDPETPREEN